MAYTTINKSTDYFNTKLFTGNGSTNAITGVGFQPDWVWIKARGATTDHVLYDAVRGVTKNLHSNTNDADDTQTDGLTAFGTDGFTVGADSKSNANSGTFASWNWRAGTGAGSSNTDGSITSTVSVNQTAGFSIVKYNGSGANSTVGHGLNSIPSVIWIKNTQSAYEWVIGHKDLDDNGTGFSNNWYYNGINTSKRNQNATASWNSTNPTNSVFSLHSGATYSNASGQENVAYCFSERIGFSKFGLYDGNANVDGAFLYCGFKPAYVLIKSRTLNNQQWCVFSNALNPFNEMTNTLQPSTNGAEDGNTTYNDIDMLSNGFKIREDNDNINATGQSYIFMAFAEAPLVGSNNVPATAR
jgi:hypothetical protein